MSFDHGTDSTVNDPDRPTPDVVRALVERALGTRVTNIDTDRLGASNAVYLATLADRARRVVRISPRGQGALVEQEIWAMRQARMRGVPTAEVVFADTTRRTYDAPYVIMQCLPGESAYRATLTDEERASVLQQLGGYLRAIHSIPIAGFGELDERTGRYIGRAASWRAYIQEEAERRLAKLPPQLLPPTFATTIRTSFGGVATDLTLDRAVLLHGDYQFKNILLQGSTVTGILDFETLIAGDPIVDFCALHYWSAEPVQTLRSLLVGYGPLAPEPVFLRRLQLYEILLALEILWWEHHFRDQSGISSALKRLRDAVAAFERSRDDRHTSGRSHCEG